MTKRLTAVIHREGTGFVALCPELDVASQGDTIEETRDNLREAPGAMATALSGHAVWRGMSTKSRGNGTRRLVRRVVVLTAKQPPTGPLRHGRLTEFLRRDLFSVKLDNGVTITAVMPEELFPIYNPNVPLSYGPCWVCVELEMREPPAIPRIVKAYHCPLLG